MPSDKFGIETAFYDEVTKQIFGNPLHNETAASRIKQVGLMVLLRQMGNQKIETTVANIIKTTGLSRPAIFVIMKPLTDRGLLIEETILNVQGRGRATRFVMAHFPAEA